MDHMRKAGFDLCPARSDAGSVENGMKFLLPPSGITTPAVIPLAPVIRQGIAATPTACRSR